jgi:hypothetical protein
VNSLSRIPPSLAEHPHHGNPLSCWASTNSRSEPTIHSRVRCAETRETSTPFAICGNTGSEPPGKTSRVLCGCKFYMSERKNSVHSRILTLVGLGLVDVSECDVDQRVKTWTRSKPIAANNENLILAPCADLFNFHGSHRRCGPLPACISKVRIYRTIQGDPCLRDPCFRTGIMEPPSSGSGGPSSPGLLKSG